MFRSAVEYSGGATIKSEWSLTVMKPRRTAYDFEKGVRSELGRWMSALRSALHFDARQKESPGG